MQQSSLFGSSIAIPDECQNSSRPLPSMSYYFYHGSIGYYSFFEHGDGAFCSADAAGYVPVPHALGSADLNGNALARDNCGIKSDTSSATSCRWSRWYVTVGLLLLSYRVLVLRRSFLLCLHFGARCKRLHEPLTLRSAFVFVNESARLAAHGASNKQRTCLLYLLIEGLMGDLFMLVARDGSNARTQYVPLGYNLASALSLLFEMFEATRWIGERTRCLVRRLFFNVETGPMGELLCAAVLHHYLTSLNRSPALRLSVDRAQAVSFYVSSLFGHGMIVLGLASSILVVRALGALFITQFSLGSIRALRAPNCVDQALRGRVKHIMLRGYEWRDQSRRHLVYTRETLKAFGLLLMRGYQLDDDASARERQATTCLPLAEETTTILVVLAVEQRLAQRCSWYNTMQRGLRHGTIRLKAVGRITGEHVKPCNVFACVGSATFCDRMLGASTSEADDEPLQVTDDSSSQAGSPSAEECPGYNRACRGRLGTGPGTVV